MNGRGEGVVIVGAGLTGLSAALHVQQADPTRSITVLERENRVGGKASSEHRQGHTFDVTGHWLHLRDDRVKRLLEALFAPGDLVEIERRTGVYTHGIMLPYPFQANLYGLPLPIVQECLVEFVAAQCEAAAGRQPDPQTFDEFAAARFGHGIAKHFFVPYNRKLWGEFYDELTPQCVARFVPIPDVHQVIGGALGLRQEGLGYNARFVYPKSGGIQAVPEALRRALEPAVAVRLAECVESIDVGTRTVQTDRGQTLSFDRLISTMPLSTLLDRIIGVPEEIMDARRQLRAIGWRYLNIATRTKPPIEHHWVYVPDPDTPFFRVGIYSNALPSMAPSGAGSLYVELTDREAPPDIPAILAALANMGAITSPQDVAFVDVRDLDCAYVVFDRAYERATTTLHGWLLAHGIRSCGRYGEWVYNSMEDSIISGMEAAQWALR